MVLREREDLIEGLIRMKNYADREKQTYEWVREGKLDNWIEREKGKMGLRVKEERKKEVDGKVKGHKCELGKET